MTEQTTVLVVEDEESFIDALTVGLRREGFRVQVARDGAQALDLFDAVNPDLVLLDVMLPRISGIDVCRQLRKRSQVPIIMVTAKGAEIDTVVGPRGRSRRLRHQALPAAGAGGPHAGGAAPGAPRPLRRPQRRRARGGRRPPRPRPSRGGDPRPRSVPMPLKEFELLAILLANAGRVLTRDTLIDRVWGSDYVGRHEDAGRPRQAAARQDRDRSRQPDPHRHHPGPGLPLRGPAGVSPIRDGRERPFDEP